MPSWDYWEGELTLIGKATKAAAHLLLLLLLLLVACGWFLAHLLPRRPGVRAAARKVHKRLAKAARMGTHYDVKDCKVPPQLKSAMQH